MKNILIVLWFALIIHGCNQSAQQNRVKTDTQKDQPIPSEPSKDDVNNLSKERNTALVGRWKNTEVLSSGSGDSYMSFSSEFFMEFREDGTALFWKGRSAGAGTSRESDEANAQKGKWYTEGKKLFLVDPLTQQKAPTFFTVDESRLLLHDDGSEKKIFNRMQ